MGLDLGGRNTCAGTDGVPSSPAKISFMLPVPAILQYAHGSPRQHSHPTGSADPAAPASLDATAVIAGAAAAARSAGIAVVAAVARFV